MNLISLRFYYVYLNTLFATLLPFGALLYLNVFTVRALRKIIAQDEIADANISFVLRKSVSNDNLEAIMEKPLFMGAIKDANGGGGGAGGGGSGGGGGGTSGSGGTSSKSDDEEAGICVA